MKDVSLRYSEGTPEALTGIDLTVEAGKRVAIVGPSGSGKTSLVALIARLYDPTEGTSTIDGADLKTVDITSLRTHTAYVSDDSFLFGDTVAENIAYARGDATRDDVVHAATLAHADGFIRELPDGYIVRLWDDRGYRR